MNLQQLLLAQGLTGRQLEIYRYIALSLMFKQRPPTYAEMMREFRIRSTNGITCHLQALERKGLLRVTKFRSLGVEVIGLTLRPKFDPTPEGTRARQLLKGVL